MRLLLAIGCLFLSAWCDRGDPLSRADLLTKPRCGSLDDLDQSRIDEREIDFPKVTRLAAEHRRATGVDGPPPTGATGDIAYLRVRDSLSQTDTAYAGYRLTGGRWLIRTGEIDRDVRQEPREIVLGAVASRRLDKVLGHRCLYDEPRYLPRNRPLRGEARLSECMDGFEVFSDIAFEGRRRTSLQTCGLGDYTEEIRAQLFVTTRNP